MHARVYSQAEIADALSLVDQVGAFFARLAWLPLTFVLWMLAQHREVQVLIPNAGFENDIATYRGFPLLQESDVPGFALWANVYIAPLLLNLAFFACLAWAATELWRKRTFMKHNAVDWAVGVPTYVIGGFFMFIVLVLLFVLDTTLSLWVDTSTWYRVEAGYVVFS